MVETLKNNQQHIFVMTAASATGKTSCAKLACQKDKQLVLSISHSTRPKRPGEREGVDKFYVSREAFADMDAQGEFVEQTEIFGHRCGHTKTALQDLMAKGCDVIMILDYQGMLQIKRQYRHVTSIFLLPPSIEAIKERIRQRPEAHGVDIEPRVESALQEMLDYKHYDYAVINDDLETAVQDLLTIVKAERMRVAHLQKSFLQSIFG